MVVEVVVQVFSGQSALQQHNTQCKQYNLEKKDLERYGSGGKSSFLAVGGLPVRSHPGRVEVSLSKTPNPQLLLTSWLVLCMAANCRWCVSVCVNVWMGEWEA